MHENKMQLRAVFLHDLQFYGRCDFIYAERKTYMVGDTQSYTSNDCQLTNTISYSYNNVEYVIDNIEIEYPLYGKKQKYIVLNDIINPKYKCKKSKVFSPRKILKQKYRRVYSYKRKYYEI